MDRRLIEVVPVLLTMYATWFTIGIFAIYLQLYAFYVVGVSNIIIGFLTTFYFLLNSISSISGGIIVDKFGWVRGVLIGSLLLLSISNFITPLYKDGLYLIIVRMLQGFSTGAIIPLVNLIGAKVMGAGEGIGTVGMFGSMGFATSGLIGGYIVNALGYEGSFILCGVITLIPLILLVMVDSGMYSDIRGSRIELRELIKFPLAIWVIYIAYSLRFVAAGGVWSFFSLFLYDLGADEYWVGIIHSINTITQILIFRSIGRYSEGRGLRIFELGLLLTSMVFLGYFLSPTYIHIIPLQMVLAISWVMLYSGANVYIIENTSESQRATGLGALQMFNALSWIVGSSANGYVSEFSGSYKTYIFASIFITLIGLLIVEGYFRIRGGVGDGASR